MLLNKAVSLIKQDVELWSKLLEFFLYRDLYESAMIVFQDAIHILKNDGMPLWHIMELYLLNTEDSMVCHYIMFITLNSVIYRLYFFGFILGS